MRVAVLADAHGNQFGFFAALSDAKRNRADLVVSAGDMLCAFPGGPQILQTLLSEGTPVVRGNADDLMVNWSRAEPTSRLRASPQFLPLQTSCVRFTESDFAIIAGWPLIRAIPDDPNTARILVCHGTPKSNLHSIADYSTEPVHSHLVGLEVKTVVAGHYHYHWHRQVNATLLALCGSCGKPVAGGIRAQYLIVDINKDGVALHHESVDYDREALFVDLNRRDFARQAGPIGWLELSELLFARPLMVRYFRHRFDPAKATDPEYLLSSVRHYLSERGVLHTLESTFGPLN